MTIIEKHTKPLLKRIAELELRLSNGKPNPQNPENLMVNYQMYLSLRERHNIALKKLALYKSNEVNVSDYMNLKEQYEDAQRIIGLYQMEMGAKYGYPQHVKARR